MLREACAMAAESGAMIVASAHPRIKKLSCGCTRGHWCDITSRLSKQDVLLRPKNISSS